MTEQEFDDYLNACHSLQDIVNVLQYCYDLNSVKLGALKKVVVKQQIKKLVKEFKPTPKNV